jgi:hypothetical protein
MGSLITRAEVVEVATVLVNGQAVEVRKGQRWRTKRNQRNARTYTVDRIRLVSGIGLPWTEVRLQPGNVREGAKALVRRMNLLPAD